MSKFKLRKMCEYFKHLKFELEFLLIGMKSTVICNN